MVKNRDASREPAHCVAARRHLGKNAKRSVGFLLCISICVGAANAAAVENPNSNSSNPPVERQPSASELKILDDLLQAGRTVDLAATLQSGRFPERDLRAWLERRAEEGHPYPQFELAERLRERDAELALKWYARARMALVLDYAECARSTESGVLEWALEAKYKKLDELARKEKGKFAVAMKEAVDREQSPHPSRSPKWICGESNPPSVDGNVLPSDRRQAERRKAFDRLVERTNDISTQVELLLNAIKARESEIRYVGHKLLWLDDEAVLFAGTETKRTATQNENSANSQQRIFLWKIRSGQVEEVMNAGDGAGMLCFDRGYLYATFRRGNEFVIRKGPIGHETELTYDKAKVVPTKGYFNPYNCRYREAPPATRPDRGVTTLLRDDHGFIEGERSSESPPNRSYFIVPPGKAPILLKGFHGGAGGPRYSAFAQAYVFQDGSGRYSNSLERHLYLVHTNGLVTNLTLPKGEWMRGTIYGLPMKTGTLMVSIAVGTGAEGAYLITDGRVRLVAKGYIGAFDVSPDGCRVAMTIQPGDFKENNKARIKQIDICGGM